MLDDAVKQHGNAVLADLHLRFTVLQDGMRRWEEGVALEEEQACVRHMIANSGSSGAKRFSDLWDGQGILAKEMRALNPEMIEACMIIESAVREGTAFTVGLVMDSIALAKHTVRT